MFYVLKSVEFVLILPLLLQFNRRMDEWVTGDKVSADPEVVEEKVKLGGKKEVKRIGEVRKLGVLCR